MVKSINEPGAAADTDSTLGSPNEPPYAPAAVEAAVEPPPPAELPAEPVAAPEAVAPPINELPNSLQQGEPQP